MSDMSQAPTLHPDELRASLSGQMPALDGLRGLAIALVMAHNLALDGGAPSALSKVVAMLAAAGWVGVTLFFVLSGFLITGILLDTKGEPHYFRAFYMRRVLRIFPLYYIVLALVLGLGPLLPSAPAVLRADAAHQAWYWLYLSNWSEVFGVQLGVFGHFWSLAVEEQFYLLWPLLVYLTSSRGLARASVGVVITACLLRVALIVGHAPADWNYHLTPCRFDALALGALLAIGARNPGVAFTLWQRLRPWLWTSAILTGVVFLAARGFARRDPLVQSAGYFASAAFFTLLLYKSITDGLTGGSRWQRFLCSRPLRVLGRYSYGLYVFHVPLNSLSLALVPFPTGEDVAAPRFLALMLVHVLVIAALTFGVAFVFYQLVEKRFLALKRHFEARA